MDRGVTARANPDGAQPRPEEGEGDVKCFRCGGRTREGIFIHLEREGSAINPETHPICPTCAVDFWKWADEVRTILTHERVLTRRGELDRRETRLKQREADVERMRRHLENKLHPRELEVVDRVR